jgi:hypothetical protein
MIPFRNFVTISKSGIKHIDWATKGMGAAQFVMIRAITRPDFIRRKTTKHRGWETIVDPNGVVHCEGPKVDIGTFGPAEHEMDEVGSSTARDGANATLCNPILMVSMGATEGNGLLEGSTVLSELSRSKDAIQCDTL